MTFISAERSIQQILRYTAVRFLTALPVTILYFEFNESKTGVPIPEKMSFRFADDVPIGSPELSSSSSVLMSL